MSFFRPAAVARLRRLAEPALTGAGAFWLGLVGIERIASETLIGGLLLLASAGLAGWCLAAAARAAMVGGGGSDPGIVEIAERRIAHFGPETGGIVALDALVTVAARVDAGGSVALWRLIPEEGAPLAIPAGAKGAEALPDALAALPGFDAFAARSRLARAGGGGEVVLWRRPGSGPRRIG